MVTIPFSFTELQSINHTIVIVIIINKKMCLWISHVFLRNKTRFLRRNREDLLKAHSKYSINFFSGLWGFRIIYAIILYIIIYITYPCPPCLHGHFIFFLLHWQIWLHPLLDTVILCHYFVLYQVSIFQVPFITCIDDPPWIFRSLETTTLKYWKPTVDLQHFPSIFSLNRILSSYIIQYNLIRINFKAYLVTENHTFYRFWWFHQNISYAESYNAAKIL